MMIYFSCLERSRLKNRNVEGDRELLLDSLCYAIIDETDQTRRNKKYVDIYDEYAFHIPMRFTSQYIRIIICILPYHDGFSRHMNTVSAQIVIHRNFADLLYCTVLYCTVLYCTYCTDADKMMNRLINCPTDYLIRFFVLSMRCDFLFPQFFFTPFFILLSLSDSICSIRYCYICS